MRRKELLAQVGTRLGTRDLFWFGTRGDDVESIADLPNLAGAFSIIGSTRDQPSVALEQLSGERVDLDAHDIDENLHTEAVLELRRRLRRSLERPSVVFTYRPSTLLSSICFTRRQTCTYLGLFKDHQSAFEHKPWVESAVADLGLPHVPWRYVTDEEQLEAERLLRDGPIVLRRNRTSGGTGLTRASTPDILEAAWRKASHAEPLLSVAPFITDAVPVNIGGVVFPDGVSVHLPSVQLIGVPSCTARPFGYCGNDFGAARDLDPTVVVAIEHSTRRIGAWLAEHGYRGAFGVDYLVRQGEPLFAEVNPRFQGSTRLSCQISASIGESCLMLEHLAALLDLPRPAQRPLIDQVRDAPDLAHAVPHWLGAQPVTIDGGDLMRQLAVVDGFVRADVLTRPAWRTLPGAPIARLTMARRLTSTGFDLIAPVDTSIASYGSRCAT